MFEECVGLQLPLLDEQGCDHSVLSVVKVLSIKSRVTINPDIVKKFVNYPGHYFTT